MLTFGEMGIMCVSVRWKETSERGHKDANDTLLFFLFFFYLFTIAQKTVGENYTTVGHVGDPSSSGRRLFGLFRL